MVDHQSYFNFDTILELLILNESFQNEQLMSVEVLSWYVDIVNYLLIGQLLKDWTKQDKIIVLAEIKNFF